MRISGPHSTKLWLLPLLVLLTAACSDSDNNNSITVQAQGYVEAVPDMLTLPLSVRETAETTAKARKAADKRVAQVTKLARAADIDEDDIDTSRLSAHPEYQWQDQQRVYKGETVRRDITLKLRDLDNYPQLMQALSELDLASISPPQLGHSDLEGLEIRALKNAMQRARKKARAIAKQAGDSLGDLKSVRESGGGLSRPMPMRAAMMDSAAKESAPEFNFASSRIEANLEVSYTLD